MSEESLNEESREMVCPHCQKLARLQLVYSRRRWKVHVPPPDSFEHRSYYVAVCERCAEVSLFVNDPPHDDIFDTFEGDCDAQTVLVWPENICAHEAVPKRVQECYEEALRTLSASRNSFATHVRRALETICNDQGISSGSLSKRIQILAFKSEMPPRLKEMTEVIRFVGNLGSHDRERNVTESEVKLVEKFFRLIVEYIYIVPFLLNELKTGVAAIFPESAGSPDIGAEPDGRVH